MKYNILLADDDASIRFVLSKYLTKAGYNVQATDNAQTLIKWAQKGDGDVILTDVHMDVDDIFTFVPEIITSRPKLPIIIMSANTSVATALKSGNAGVFEYIPKPFDLHNLEQVIRRALDKQPSVKKKQQARARRDITEPIIGKSVVMQPVFRGVSDYMSADLPVFISGDVGTGKNHVARLIHASGSRSQRPFVSFDDYVSVGALIEAVQNGDIYVDRVHELSVERQSLLLRALEKNEQNRPQEAFRVISSANIQPHKIRENGCVRSDLFFRLKGGEIYLPPLSHRIGDIEELARHFLRLNNRSKQRTINVAAMKILTGYHWPGNVRELKSLMQIITHKYADNVITEDILKSVLGQDVGETDSLYFDDFEFNDLREASIALFKNAKSDERTPYVQALSWVEKPLIEEALRFTGGNNLRAAELLGIHRNTLRTKIKTLGITSD